MKTKRLLTALVLGQGLILALLWLMTCGALPAARAANISDVNTTSDSVTAAPAAPNTVEPSL